jgi:predicted ThiF/HesA family dinucleotide-utilizing enzyme
VQFPSLRGRVPGLSVKTSAFYSSFYSKEEIKTMKLSEAIEEAKKRLADTGQTQAVLRRGTNYKVDSNPWPPRGWRIAEMIGPGNVQNF